MRDHDAASSSLGLWDRGVLRLITVEGKITNLVRSLEDGVLCTEIVNNRLRELTREKEELSGRVKPVAAPPQIDVEELRTYLKRLKQAIAKGTPAEIKQFIGECVDVMTLYPDEVKVSIQQKAPGSLSPGLYQPMVAGARLGAIHEKLENWKVEVWDLPTKGRRKDLGRAAADKRSAGEAVAAVATSVSSEMSPAPHSAVHRTMRGYTPSHPPGRGLSRPAVKNVTGSRVQRCPRIKSLKKFGALPF